MTVVLAVSVLSTLLLVAAPAKADEHVPYANGCTAVPDSGSNWNFHNACDQHDKCYVDRPYGVNEGGRKRCDDEFYNRMTWDCVYRAWWWPRQDCFNVAGAYWVGVRSFGGWVYYDWSPWRRAEVRIR
jgi:hypothetical protein